MIEKMYTSSGKRKMQSLKFTIKIVSILSALSYYP